MCLWFCSPPSSGDCQASDASLTLSLGPAKVYDCRSVPKSGDFLLCSHIFTVAVSSGPAASSGRVHEGKLWEDGGRWPTSMFQLFRMQLPHLLFCLTVYAEHSGRNTPGYREYVAT